jgi:hypothetical protein
VEGANVTVARLVAAGHRLCLRGNGVPAAEAYFRRAVALEPDHAMAHNNLGWTRQAQGDLAGAIEHYEIALRLAPDLSLARRNLALVLVQCGRSEESLPLWRAELASGRLGVGWAQRVVDQAMYAPDLTVAGELAGIVARLRWGADPVDVEGAPKVPISIPKLRHDAGQFRHLQAVGVFGAEMDGHIAAFEELAERMAARGPEARVALDDPLAGRLSPVYNRLLHVRDTPRVERALSDSWDRAEVQDRYLDRAPGVVVVDDFLSPEALDGLRRFCLESTVWFGNRYAHGRLGAFFQDGFTCPLLVQIAEELRVTLPRVIGDRYPLRQLWGFKSGPELPADATTHADFAAVNVNFWITPQEANLDPESGGLVVYDVDAPMHWDFETYNGRTDVIKPFLQRQQSRAITIPYRANRAVIFNSDLFHGTDAVHFRPGYDNLRVNITMLYGEREQEVHHRDLARHPDPLGAPGPGASAWRSAAFRRNRRWPAAG